MKSLVTALISAQKEFPKVAKDSTNPHFKSKYLSLEGLLDAVMPILHKHGLTIIQTFNGDELVTTLAHESGETMAGNLKLSTDKAGPQALMSAISYARRYATLAILNLAASDDDGEAAERRTHDPKETAQLVGAMRDEIAAFIVDEYESKIAKGKKFDTKVTHAVELLATNPEKFTDDSMKRLKAAVEAG